MDLKKCGRCKNTLAINNFNKNRTNKDGYGDRCKACIKNFLDENKEKIADYKRQYYFKNKQRLDEYKNAWNKDNRNLSNGYSKKYYSENKEQIKVKLRKRYVENKMHRRVVAKLWMDRNREKVRNYRSEGEKRWSLKLTDGYIRKLLTSHKSGLKASCITQELVDLKRVQVQITRKLKEIKSCNQPQSPT